MEGMDLQSPSSSSTETSPDTAAETHSAGSTQEPSPQPQSQGAGTSLPQAGTQGSEGRASVLPTPGQVPSPYTPNFKYKVSNQEKEMADWVRGYIKDADTEKKFRELWEKADGLDFVKPKLEKTRERAQQLEQAYSGMQGQVKELAQLRDTDLDAFLNAWEISEEKLFKHVLSKLEYDNLPPEQKRALDSERQTRHQNRNLEQKYQDLETRFQQQAVQARTMEMTQAVHSPDVRSFADAFDALYGNSGAFEAEVIKIGKQVYLESGQDISAGQAVKLAMDHYGKFVNAAGPQGQAQGSRPQAQPGTQAQAQAKSKPPVIPVVQGQAASPMGREIRSIQDLKKARDEAFAR